MWTCGVRFRAASTTVSAAAATFVELRVAVVVGRGGVPVLCMGVREVREVREVQWAGEGEGEGEEVLIGSQSS